MASNENEATINNAILDLVRNGRGHGRLGKKMPFRPRNDEPPPGYGNTEELWAPPNYDTEGKAAEKPSAPEKFSATMRPSVAEKAPVAAERPKVAPLFFIPTKKIKPSPVCTLQA